MERICIVVLGAGVRPDGRPGRALQQRVDTALALARRHPAATLVVSGGRRRGRPAEAVVIARLLMAGGVAPTRIVVEDRSRDTLDNVRACAPLVRAAAPDRVLLVTSGYHLPRARLLFRVLGIVTEGIAARPPPTPAGVIGTCAAWAREIVALPWDLALALTGMRNVGRD